MNLPDYLAVVAGCVQSGVQSGTDHNFPEDSYRANRGLSPFTRWEIA
jgi:hypothetical protein